MWCLPLGSVLKLKWRYLRFEAEHIGDPGRANDDRHVPFCEAAISRHFPDRKVRVNHLHVAGGWAFGVWVCGRPHVQSCLSFDELLNAAAPRCPPQRPFIISRWEYLRVISTSSDTQLLRSQAAVRRPMRNETEPRVLLYGSNGPSVSRHRRIPIQFTSGSRRLRTLLQGHAARRFSAESKSSSRLTQSPPSVCQRGHLE